LLANTLGVYARYVLHVTTDVRYARAGRLEGGGVGEIGAAYWGTSERLVGLAYPRGESSVVRRKVA